LYVAECDIRGFFDCVSHEVAKASLRDAIVELHQLSPHVVVDQRAIRIFDAYLESYSFSTDVLVRGAARLKRIDAEGKFKWPESDLKVLHAQDPLPSIGVPQGGALSCLMANLVLHTADKRVQGVSALGSTFLYMRYCDDMIIVASEERACREAFREYFDSLLYLRLPAHPAKTVHSYDRAFWDGKSNGPYVWNAPQRNGIPWVQFVGYQVRYDGLVRVRPKSLRKQFRKLTVSADEVLRVLSRGNSTLMARKRPRQILYRLRQRLIAISVGRVQFGQPRSGPMPMCWANGFRGLFGRHLVVAHLRALDRHRERQLSQLCCPICLALKARCSLLNSVGT